MIHVAELDSGDTSNATRMSLSAGSTRSIDKAVVAMSADTKAMNSRRPRSFDLVMRWVQTSRPRYCHHGQAM